jgi:hypothetical protein
MLLSNILKKSKFIPRNARSQSKNFMNSIWLCSDALPSKALRRTLRKPRGQRSYLGVFTADPAEIGRWLPRPVTPFVPAETPLFIQRHMGSLESDAEPAIESPRPKLTFDLGEVRFRNADTGLSIF